MGDILNDTQTNIIALLARFKFLVLSQLKPLLKKSTSYVRAQLASLANQGYIGSYRLDRPGKAENMYYLTEAGKEIILQHAKIFDGDIKLPIGVPLIVKDYSHRKNMISVTISLYYHLLQAEISMSEFISYFDKQGNNRKSHNLEARTKIPLGDGFFIPDGFMLTENGEKKTMYMIEMYCDASSTRVLDQLHKHILAIAQGAPAAKFGVQANPFVLSAFEHDSIKAKVIEKLTTNTGFQPFKHLFYFGNLDDIVKDCGSAWKDINNRPLVFK